VKEEDEEREKFSLMQPEFCLFSTPSFCHPLVVLSQMIETPLVSELRLRNKNKNTNYNNYNNNKTNQMTNLITATART